MAHSAVSDIMLEEPESKSQEKSCIHGYVYYCELCNAEKIPKCKHGNVYYCGIYGVIVGGESNES